jgi:hypothetical protein
MKGLIVFLGESFRFGITGTRCRGVSESFSEQIAASNTHISFIKHIKNKYNLDISIFISTYHTQYDNDLLDVYKEYLIDHDMYDDVIGLNNLLHNSIKRINIQNYDFVFFIRIDLFLKDYFFEIFNPNINMILFPTICWKEGYITKKNHPRINDTMIFVPKKYYDYFKDIDLCHDCWEILIENTDLKYDDMDAMIHTYHDSDSNKDFNPLYYVVNRPENQVFHSEGDIFNKFDFLKQHEKLSDK